MLRALFASSRYVVGFAVIGTFLGSVVLLVMGALSVFRTAWQEIKDLREQGWGIVTGSDPGSLSGHHVERLGVEFIQVTDIILLGTVLYIVSLGLYQLFIDHSLPLPRWLQVDDLADLKRDLISVVVVLLGVTFLGEVVDWNGESAILQLGISVALVIAALSIILWLTPNHQNNGDIDIEH
jgi:uncharacterized membrane protein YqhA